VPRSLVSIPSTWTATRSRDERHRHAEPLGGFARARTVRSAIRAEVIRPCLRLALRPACRSARVHRLDSNSKHQFVRDIARSSLVSGLRVAIPASNPHAAVQQQPHPDEPQALARYSTWSWCRPCRVRPDPAADHRDDSLRLTWRPKPGRRVHTHRGRRAPRRSPAARCRGKLHAPLCHFGLELTAFALGGAAWRLCPQLVDLLRWGRTLSTAKSAASFASARTRYAGRVRRLHPAAARAPLRTRHHAYQYEKELEDFIHSASWPQRTAKRKRGLPAKAPTAPSMRALPIHVARRV